MTAARLPETIGPYKILRRLGKGGMAEVYVAQDTTSGEEHALKIMIPGSPHADRFNQEYEALTRLNHPGIVRVYQYGLYKRAPWFSMELIAGEPLQVWVKRVGRPGTPARTKEVMRAGAFLADAVAYIHERGLIHRDLKGNNVLMLPDGRVKLLDFGTAHIRDGLRQLTKPGEFIGTLAYASPEQFRGKAVDHLIDIYALGVLLYRMATGHRPFSADDPASLARLIAKADPKSPRELVPDIPEGLEELMLQLLAKNPDNRPQTARKVARRLEELIGEPLGLPGWGAAARVDRMSGREEVLKQLRKLLEPTGRALLLLGAPGSDRERIGEHVIKETRADKRAALVARLTEQDAVLDLLDMLIAGADEAGFIEDRRVDAAVSAVRLMRKRGRSVALRNRAGITQAAVSVLVGLARIRGDTLVTIQDVHLADPPTLDIISELFTVTQKGGLDVRFLLTAEFRDRTVVERIMRRMPDTLRLVLAPLTVHQVALKVGGMLDRRPPPFALAQMLHRASGGQPLWVESLVDRLLSEGAIRLIGQDGNRIEWDINDDLEIPEEASERILAELLALPALERRLIAAIAIAGAPTPLKVVTRSLGWTLAQVVPLLRSLSDAGWIRVGDGQVHLSQPLVGHLAPALIHATRYALLESILSDAIDDAPPRPEHVTLLLQDGRPTDAVRRAVQGANALLDDLRTVEALEMLDRIAPLAIDPPDDVNPSLLSQALLLHADCMLMLRPVDPTLARSLAGARKLASHSSTEVGVLLAEARLARTLGHLVNHHKKLKEAEDAAESSADPRLVSQVACERAGALRLAGRIRDADRWVETAMTAGAEAGEQPLLWARVTEASVRVGQGRFAEALSTLDNVIDGFTRLDLPRGIWACLPSRATVLRLQGRYTEALDAIYQFMPQVRRCQEPTPLIRLLLVAAECEADLHRLGRAQEHIDEIDTLVRKGEQLDLRLVASLLRGRILLSSGHLRPAHMTLDEAHQRARAAGLPAISEVARALTAETLQALDNRRGARDLFASAILGLMGAGDAAALVEGTLARLRAMGPSEPSSQILKPIHTIMHRENLRIVTVERLLADARHHERWQRTSDARSSALEAQAALDELSEHLSDTDRAALRLHPWSRHIRAILR